MTQNFIPRIVKKLLADGGREFRRYFHQLQISGLDKRIWDRISKINEDQKEDKWILKFRKKVEDGILYHDEPWMTLVALYGLFGNQNDLNNPKRINSLNGLLSNVFFNRQGNPDPPRFNRLDCVHLEVRLPEILRYREYIHRTIFKNGAYHPYPDKKRMIESKLKKVKASFEGNTNLDVLISGKSENRNIHLFMEAKLMSDISKDITYVPVRNQIARTIDCGINLMTYGGDDLDGLKDFWFFLLTPAIFRTEKYGGPVNSPLTPFLPDRSRLFCYKMDDYLDPFTLKKDLPHWDGVLKDEDWVLIASHLGWLTYEDIVSKVMSNGLMDGKDLRDYEEFFHERGMV